MTTTSLFFSFIFLIFFSSFSMKISADSPRRFIQYLTKHSQNSESITELIFTPANFSYNPVLQLTLQNLWFNTSKTRKPLTIVTPVDEAQIQIVIYCARKTNMNIRMRGGGHDFEGLSYTAEVPFVLLDMINFDKVNIDLKSGTAWVQPGLSLGQLYYKISQKSDVLGFPAGLWSTVGLTGFLGGGGYGMMKRKYGLAADNTLDARIMDYNGIIYDRKTMGEDLFWAIRGGDPASFGVILEWKIKLVPVPELVTYFAVVRTLEQNGSKLFQKWQSTGPNVFPRDLDVKESRVSQNNLSLEALNGLWEMWLKQPVQTTLIQYTPFGGRMNDSAESVLPFFSVKFNRFCCSVSMSENEEANTKWINELFKYYGVFVKNPRTSYVNYRDLDLGTGSKTYEEASQWGKRYYKNKVG